MKLTIPLYQEKYRNEGQDVFFVRPLFFDHVEASRPELRRATDSVRNAVRKVVQTMGQEMRHDALCWATQCPEISEHHIKVRIQLRRRTVETSYLFCTWTQNGVRLAFTPRLPGLMFEVGRGEDLAARAEQVLTAHYRKLERDQETVDPNTDGIRGSGWISYLDLNVSVESVHVAPRKADRAEIGSFENMRGADELHKVGRLLNSLYPDDLGRAVRRSELVTGIVRLLSHPDRRPLLLLGRSGVGKTALVHEVVRRRMDKNDEQSNERRQMWLISPQRLISGMSYVGQWENRVHAILSECRRRSHVLYFDDFIGLFRAGISASSKISAAQVLKPHIEKREVRLLVEMTPDQFRVLQELDRGFADLFHIIPVDEPDEEENLRILIHSQRELEARHKCRFQYDVLPTSMDLMQRYQREVAYPGKVAGFLQQLAVKSRNGTVTRLGVLNEFESRSGLRVTFLDETRRLSRDEILNALQQRIVGQGAAVNALADVVSVAKARLNDPDRPLGTFLFLGPTGVGKTESAKALAEYLYGDASKLLRFDMNELTDESSVARLVGTISEPEGLLTSAVRRQPFSTILLDEIEKAHPAAFDVLLQVLGEGRLTDALGRTADFTNCVIIMTSNLGVREAQGGLGVGGHESRGDEAYMQAARRFFRPEFFNRIDRIVPFTRLERNEIQQIAQHLLQEVFAREGLARRFCVLQVDALAMERVVDKGYHPTLGARAIKREIERQLTRPLSSRLSELNPQVPTIVHLLARGEDVAVRLIPLEPVERAGNSVVAESAPDIDALVARIDPLLNAAEEVLESLQPGGAIQVDAVTPDLRRYFALREQVQYLDNAVERLLDWRDREAERSSAPVEASASLVSENRPRRSQLSEALPVPDDAWLTMRSPNQLQAFLTEHAEDPGEDELKGRMRRLSASASSLALMTRRVSIPDEQALLVLRSVNGQHSLALRGIADSFAAMLRYRFDLSTELFAFGKQGAAAVVVSGYLAHEFCQALGGIHLWCSHKGLLPIQAISMPLQHGADPAEAASELDQRRRDWAESVARGNGSVEEDPVPHGKVLQVHYSGGPVLDVRTGMLSRERPSLALMASWLLAAFDLPEVSV
ncbi:MAG: ATP-dependent Clp protease ATP-binding subunit [Planctomycetes bacterium]|nr:ATP-dependent Clp protease ATP-binding subunit [Planctomycetota bacterium]